MSKVENYFDINNTVGDANTKRQKNEILEFIKKNNPIL